jgi:predicted ATPase
VLARLAPTWVAELPAHFEHGRDYPRAVGYHQQAPERAARLSAHGEAEGHARRGLDLLDRVDETSDRDAQELGLQMILGLQLQIGQGFAAPGVELAYARAWELCGRARAEPRLVPVLWGLWMFYAVRAANRTAPEVAGQLLRLGEQVGDPTARLCGHNAAGVIRLFVGEPAAARADLERAAVLYDPDRDRGHAWQYGQDLKVTSLAHWANALWLTGEPDRALEASREAVALARQLVHPHSLALALYFAAVLHQRRQDPGASRECAEELIRLADEHGYGLWSAGGAVLRGRALAEQGSPAEGVAEIRRGLAAWRATGALVNLSYQLALLAEVLAAAGQAEEAHAALDEAAGLVRGTGEGYYEPELHRLKGELLRAEAEHRGRPKAGGTKAVSANRPGSPSRAAEDCFHKAVAIARHQGARSLELRAAVSLARLVRRRGDGEEARRLLAVCCDGFPKGVETPDLQDARELIGEAN